MLQRIGAWQHHVDSFRLRGAWYPSSPVDVGHINILIAGRVPPSRQSSAALDVNAAV